MPHNQTLSTLKESDERKAEPTLWALRMLSRTTTSPVPGASRYSSELSRSNSILSNFLSRMIKQRICSANIAKMGF